MFTNNAKFKLWFWGITFIITCSFGVVGLIKNLNDTKEEREQARISTKETSAIIVEGNIASKADEADLQRFITSILNDSKDQLVVSGNDITLTDKGKLTSTIKYMYLNGEISFTNGINTATERSITTKVKTLYGNLVKIEPFRINYSSDICGTSGYDSSLNASYGTGETGANENCEPPFIFYVFDKYRYDKDTYVVNVYVAYVNEREYNGSGEEFTDQITCSENQKQFFRTVDLYSDIQRQNSVYQNNVTGCCSSETCKAAGFTKLRTSLRSPLMNLGNVFYFRFNKTSDGKDFQLVSITKGK